MLTFSEIESRLRSRQDLRLVAIDGMPCSGKSTLAQRLIDALGWQCICLDEFVIPESQWPTPWRPAFPFPYIRYVDFMSAVRDVHRSGKGAYHPFDWRTMETSATPKTIIANTPVLVEGVSSLHPDLAPLYDLTIYVDSDESTALATALARGHGNWEAQWRDYFMPSAALYFASNPRSRAGIIAAGRGA